MMNETIAIVTGANKGLGFAIAKGLCEKFKGTVYVTSRNERRGRVACEELKRLGHTPEYHQLDVTNDNSILSFCSFIRAQNKKVHLLVNNAGILFLKDATEPMIYQAEQTVGINFFALVNFTETILPIMNENGSILNITSSSGHLSRIPSVQLRKNISDPNLNLEELKVLMKSYVESVKLSRQDADGWGNSPYVVSKVGVNAYTFMLSRRLTGRGIYVNCVHPGYVMTDMTRGSGSVTPDQASEVILKWALEPESSGSYVWHNGVQVQWDGPDPRKEFDNSRL